MDVAGLQRGRKAQRGQTISGRQPTGRAGCLRTVTFILVAIHSSGPTFPSGHPSPITCISPGSAPWEALGGPALSEDQSVFPLEL